MQHRLSINRHINFNYVLGLFAQNASGTTHSCQLVTMIYMLYTYLLPLRDGMAELLVKGAESCVAWDKTTIYVIDDGG